KREPEPGPSSGGEKPIRFERLRLHTKSPPAKFTSGIAIPLHDCREQPVLRTGGDKAGVEDDRLPRGRPRETIVRNRAIRFAEVLAERHERCMLLSAPAS